MRRGHAIEVRVNAEDPTGGTVPAVPGHAAHGSTRPAGPGVRVDAGYEAGDTVSQFYDNLIAKIVTWGRGPRARAAPHAARPRGDARSTGVATTIPADVAILSHPDFVAGEHSTKWVEERLDLDVGRPRLRRAPTTRRRRPGPARRSPPRSTAAATRWTCGCPPAASATAVAAKPSRRGEPRGRGRQRHGRGDRPDAGDRGQGARRPWATPSRRARRLHPRGDEDGELRRAERAGTVAELRVAAGDAVGAGDVVAVVG